MDSMHKVLKAHEYLDIAFICSHYDLFSIINANYYQHQSWEMNS